MTRTDQVIHCDTLSHWQDLVKELWVDRRKFIATYRDMTIRLLEGRRES